MMCDEVKPFHSFTRATKGHHVVLLDHDKLKDNSSTPLFCPEHQGEQYRFHCVPCKKLVCRDCVLLDHEGHKRQSIKQASGIARDAIGGLIQKAHTRAEKLGQAEAVVRETRQELSRQETQAREEINVLRTEVKFFLIPNL
jgi:B-box zinc finger